MTSTTRNVKDEATRRNEIVKACTSFQTWEELDIAMDYHGYVPTIDPRKSEKHYRLTQMIKNAGFRSWSPVTGKNN